MNVDSHKNVKRPFDPLWEFIFNKGTKRRKISNSHP